MPTVLITEYRERLAIRTQQSLVIFFRYFFTSLSWTLYWFLCFICIGNCGETRNTGHVILIATHADVVRAPRLPSGDLNSPQASSLVKRLRSEFWPYFDIHPSPIVIDGHQPNSYGVKVLKTSIAQLKSTIYQVNHLYVVVF